MPKILCVTTAMGVFGAMSAVGSIGALGAACCLRRYLRRRLFFV